MNKAKSTTEISYNFRVRQVRRGFWTYDIHCIGGFEPEEYSIGECNSRREAEKQARKACKAKQSENAAR